MFRHMAILRFKPDAKPADIAAYFEAFPTLMATQPTIKDGRSAAMKARAARRTCAKAASRRTTTSA
jgi:hypothetical protein